MEAGNVIKAYRAANNIEFRFSLNSPYVCVLSTAGDLAYSQSVKERRGGGDVKLLANHRCTK
jgi:hypothetical protein